MLKISTVLSFMYLLMFNEYDGNTEKHIHEFMNCMKTLLEGFGEKKEWDSNVTDSFTKNWYGLLHSKDYNVNAEVAIGHAWKNVKYWIETVYEAKKGSDISIQGEYFYRTIIEIINKIIFFSNAVKMPQE
jgi:hypothetical protein